MNRQYSGRGLFPPAILSIKNKTIVSELVSDISQSIPPQTPCTFDLTYAL